MGAVGDCLWAIHFNLVEWYTILLFQANRRYMFVRRPHFHLHLRSFHQSKVAVVSSSRKALAETT